MFSYLEVAQKLVSREIYGRGIKYYLEGKVLRYDELVLDFWRLYQVSENHENVLVKIPLLHLALSQHKYDQADKALSEVTTCNCSYFQEYGACKHIVAVCASIEQEFGLNKKPAVQNKNTEKKVDSLLETIFEAETDKKTRRWLSQIEAYIYSSTPADPNWFDEAIGEVANDNTTYLEFQNSFKDIILEALKTWEAELRVINLIKQSLYFGGKFWWRFWQPYLDRLEDSNKLKLWVAIWKMYIVGVFKEFQEEFLMQLRQLSDVTKKDVLDVLKKEFTGQSKVWINFAIESHFSLWLQANLDIFDPLNLLKIYFILPDEQDEIERRVYKQIKIWSDFLQPGNYKDVVDTMKKWETSVGRTDMYEMALKYIKDNHGKKKKLILEIEK
jgi:hypothetical protein